MRSNHKIGTFVAQSGIIHWAIFHQASTALIIAVTEYFI